MLTAYQHDIEYRSTTKHVNTDCLYHLPVHSDEVNEDVDEVRLMNLLQIESLKKFGCKNSVLSRSGTVTEQTSPVSHKVLVEEQLWKHHVDQMHQRHLNQKLV